MESAAIEGDVKAVMLLLDSGADASALGLKLQKVAVDDERLAKLLAQYKHRH
jgi:hypothetical protein